MDAEQMKLPPQPWDSGQEELATTSYNDRRSSVQFPSCSAHFVWSFLHGGETYLPTKM